MTTYYKKMMATDLQRVERGTCADSLIDWSMDGSIDGWINWGLVRNIPRKWLPRNICCCTRNVGPYVQFCDTWVTSIMHLILLGTCDALPERNVWKKSGSPGEMSEILRNNRYVQHVPFWKNNKSEDKKGCLPPQKSCESGRVLQSSAGDDITHPGPNKHCQHSEHSRGTTIWKAIYKPLNLGQLEKGTTLLSGLANHGYLVGGFKPSEK